MSKIPGLDTILSSIINIDRIALKRQGKDFDFVDVYPFIEEGLEHILYLENETDFWDYLPNNERTNIMTTLKTFVDSIIHISDFDPNKIPNPKQMRDTLSATLSTSYSQLFKFLIMPQDVFRIKISLKSGGIDKLRDESMLIKNQINSQKEESDKILSAMRSASASTGVSKFAKIFDNESESCKKTASIWLIASILSAILISSVLVYIFHDFIDTIQRANNIESSIQIFFSKIIIISFFSVVWYQIVKNYNAHMHLYILNKHRSNSLKTFQTFVESSTDVNIKDSILLQATKTIFEAGDTGYISSKDTNLTGLETIKIYDQISKK